MTYFIFSYLSCPEQDDFDIEQLIEGFIMKHKSNEVICKEHNLINHEKHQALENISDMSTRRCSSLAGFEKIKESHKDSHISWESSFLHVNKVMSEEMKISPELCYRVRKTMSSKHEGDISKSSKSSNAFGQKYSVSELRFEEDFALESEDDTEKYRNKQASSKHLVRADSILLKLESASNHHSHVDQ